MDTLLERGDHALDGRGLPVSISGEREIIQRALLRLCIRRGAFPADPALGSELHRLRGARAETLERLALSYALEALFPMPGVSVHGVRVRREEGENLTVNVALGWNGQTFPLEVRV